MTDADRIAEAIDRNTKALEGVHDTLSALGQVFEHSLIGQVDPKWAVETIVAAIRGKPEP